MIVHHAPVAQAIVGHIPILSPHRGGLLPGSRSSAARRTTATPTARASATRRGAGRSSTSGPKWRSSAITTTWQFPRDLSIIGFLEAKFGYEYEVVDRPRPAPRGARAARRLRRRHHGLAPGVLVGAGARRAGGLRRPTAAGSCTWAATASTGSSPPRGRAVADGGPQGRGRHARVAGAARASCTTRPRPSAAGCGACAAARRRSSPASASRPRASTTAGPTGACPTRSTSRSRGSSTASATTS